MSDLKTIAIIVLVFLSIFVCIDNYELKKDIQKCKDTQSLYKILLYQSIGQTDRCIDMIRKLTKQKGDIDV
jgi:hypothetical protein